MIDNTRSRPRVGLVSIEAGAEARRRAPAISLPGHSPVALTCIDSQRQLQDRALRGTALGWKP